MKRKSIVDIRNKKGQTPIVCLTAYTSYMAQLMDHDVDLILVGDSLGMVNYGMESTVPVSMEMMIWHGRAVVQGASQALVVVDMPFGSYQVSPEDAYKNAVTLMKETGCAAVKLEGGVEMAETISFLTQRGVAVLGHVGLKPQSVNAEGGYRMTGKGADERAKISADARAVQEAGGFAVVLECVEASLAADITNDLDIPTIGIGASVSCDGQILVTEDVLGMTGGYVPSFAKQYDHLAERIQTAVRSYASDVRTKNFPEQKPSVNKTAQIVDRNEFVDAAE